VDPTAGDVLIDSVNISGIARNTVRDRLICLPQEPLLLPGTIQFNLDPQGGMFDIARIEAVLKQVQMLDVVMGKGGLSAELKLDSLSVGEQQLLALARAIIKKQLACGRCILVLDEFTSNLDPKTEAVVQEVIRDEFRNNTVLAIAHRLDTLRDFDTVMVLDKGKVSKVGPAAEVIAELKAQ
jgi:ABC-type multidrug transport system fused ATPase/permease subunit